MPKNYIKALAVLVGYIIGVGMFGLPYLVSRSGLLIFFVMIIILGMVQHLLHLIFANTIVVTKPAHRLPGYAGIYLGKTWEQIAMFAQIIGNYGALLAYIIITGIFTRDILAPFFGGSEFMYATIMFAIQAVIIFMGLGALSGAELLMTAVMLGVVLWMTLKGAGEVSTANYTWASWRYALLPYGAVLFAVDGNGAIPIVVKLVGKSVKSLRSIIRYGTIIPVIVIVAFTLVIVGISGDATTPDALTGVRGAMGNTFMTFALLFGILTMVTSFLGVAEAMRETFRWDYKLSKNTAWLLAVLVPYLMYLIGFKSLIDIISFAGAVAGGASAIILILIFDRLEQMRDKLPLFKHKPKQLLNFALIVVFACGIFYEIINFIK